MDKKILVTGGCGYIGSHTLISLSMAGYIPIVLDNLSNSSLEALKQVENILGERIKFYNVDILDKLSLKKIFSENDFEAVVHFAGLKSVSDSFKRPISYYKNNVSGTIALLEIMEKSNIKNLVFSSSATVYCKSVNSPIKENSRLCPTNPYGNTKLTIEKICRDLTNSSSEKPWNIFSLRYFNPVGSHESGLIGEDPSGIPNNLMPYISQVAVGELDILSIFGNDYPTSDGTGVRDFIHVTDLAEGHVSALNWIMKEEKSKSICREINLGTGRGTSVLELVNLFEKETGIKIPYKFAPRRNGDNASSYADPSLAKSLLNWEAKKSIENMIEDTWRWQSKNPKGYKKS